MLKNVTDPSAVVIDGRATVRRARNLQQIFIHIMLFALAFCTLFPFYLMVNSSFKYKMQIVDNVWFLTPPFHLDNYINAIRQISPFMLNSIIVTAGIVLGVVVVAVMAGYAFVRFDMPGGNLLFFLIISLMMIPSFLLLLPQFVLVNKMGLLNTYAVQILPPIGALAPMAVLLARTYFASLSTSLFEAASIDGAGELRILLSVVVPLSMPVIATIAVIDSLAGWNNFIWPLMTASKESVKPVIIALQGIMNNTQNEQGVQLAGYVAASIPLLLFFLLATKQFVSGLSSGAIKA
ncbi:carbohydrate ABC transporter permease [Paenibacillus thalictri]|uniref:Carbohydrate ABC transporter permease n=1 Tax=Paenibacillus thalictri TaxID=2527873 RepID=A0A4Q9DUC8_9BACL|nr:carbohydrate ABC transporter permease [Paenibacillus thalictri]TBL79143.1 carbohydrate ABC transporter permease [Paenibacillus thalictri]